MENIMSELIEIENSANEFIKRADEEKKKLPARISLRTFELEKMLEKEAKDKLDEMKSRTDSETIEAVAEIKLANENKIALISAEYQANKNDWINSLYDSILNGS